MLTSRFALALPLSVLLAACGGRTLDAPDASTDAPAGCVVITVTPDELTCEEDSDCTQTTTGTVCEDTCGCGGTAVNQAGASAIASQVQGLEQGLCPCAVDGLPRCIQHECHLCGGFANDPSCDGILDSGVIDTGLPDVGVDAFVGDAMHGIETGCVDVDPSSYATNCQTSSDCILIETGELCNGDCFCGGTAVNASGEGMYDQAIESIVPGDCECPVVPSPVCFEGQCVVCNGPNSPAGCGEGVGFPDAG